MPTNVVSLPLKHVNHTIYATAIEQDKYLNNTRMYLAISAETAEDSIIRKVPQMVKVCSATHIEQLISNALPGVTLTSALETTSDAASALDGADIVAFAVPA